jgi:hypothetical protein
MMSLKELAIVEIPNYYLSNRMPVGVGRKMLAWLNERTDSDIMVRDEQRWLFHEGKYWCSAASREVTLTKGENYDIYRRFVGVGWIYEMAYQYHWNADAAKSYNSWIRVYFDDELLAIEFKLVAPWENL